MAITKVINDLIDLNQTGDYSGIRLPAGTTADRTQTFTTDYLVVAGGGGGARGYAGGGGAGGLRTSYNNSTTTTNLLSFPSGKTAMATYMLNGDATDVSTNYNGAESSITYVAGEYGGAASFNGSNSGIQINTFSGFTNYNFTLSIWIKTTDTVGYITSFRDPIYITFGTGIYSAGSNGMGIYDGTNSYYINNTAMQGINDGNWHHIAMTHDGTNLKGYIDGSIIATVSTGTTTQSSGGTNYNRIGLRADGNTSSAYNGLVDQLRLYNSALSENDISNIYNNEVQANSGGGSAAESSLTLSSSTSYNVTVGQGGAGVTGNGVSGSGANGQNSIFSVITSNGGGGGGDYNNNSPGVQNGGAGGGGGAEDAGGVSGNGTINQGYDGGVGSTTGIYRGGGGGGAGGVGIDGNTSGNGGNAVSINIIGSATAYAGGGGGGLYSVSSGNAGSGGSNIGGDGAKGAVNAESGTNNTGSGGGGAGGVGNGYNGGGNAGDGGSGVVILRYPTASVSSFTTTGTLNTPSTTDTLASATYPITNTAYYKLDGDAADSSGNGYNGNDSNVTWANGKFSQAAKFPALASSYINTGITSLGSDFSLSFWFNPDYIDGSAGYRAPLGKYYSGSGDAELLLTFNDNGTVATYVYYGGGSSSNVSSVHPNTVSNGNWYHYCITWENGVQLKTYLNNVAATTTTSQTKNTNTVPLYIGALDSRTAGGGSTWNSYAWSGLIDQVRIFSTALSGSQVTELYEEHYQTKFTDGSDTAIVFTEGTGTISFTGTSPAPPSGAIRYNTTTKTIEFYNGEWVETATS